MLATIYAITLSLCSFSILPIYSLTNKKKMTELGSSEDGNVKERKESSEKEKRPRPSKYTYYSL